MPLRKDTYKRMYIMLEQDEIGSALLKDKEITGYLKVETRSGRGRITASLQNLDPNFSYNVKFLKSGENPQIIEFGAVRVDDKGRGGAEWTFDTDNVMGSGSKFDDLSVAFVEADNGNKLVTLSSIMDKTRFNWKSIYKKLMKSSDIKNAENKNEITQEEKPYLNEIPKGEPQNYAVPEFENTKTGEPEIEIQLDTETEINEIQNINIPEEKTEFDTNAEIKKEADKDAKSKDKESKGYEINSNEKNNGYVKYLREYVNNIVNYLDEVYPFEKGLEGYRWWRIKTGNKDSYYDHYLVGFVNDEKGKLKYIVYGMPGLFTLSDQPFGGMTGFVYWNPVKENMRSAGDAGYWLMHIDASTGQIAIPKGPTPPPII